jgi:cytidine deaminase
MNKIKLINADARCALSEAMASLGRAVVTVDDRTVAVPTATAKDAKRLLNDIVHAGWVGDELAPCGCCWQPRFDFLAARQAIIAKIRRGVRSGRIRLQEVPQ